MIEDVANWPIFYQGMHLNVYSPDHYYRGSFYNHEHSSKIVNSKVVDESDYFIPKMRDLMESLISEGKIKNVDLLTIIPKSDLSYSKTLDPVALDISNSFNIKFERIIIRKVTGRRNIWGSGAEKRYDKTKDSMELIRPLAPDEKDILLLDDQKTTGITFLECAKILIEAGAEHISCICFGINRNLDKYPL